jgi:hypothetical protein
VIAAVLLNAALPGAGHAALGRWGAALAWCVATFLAYFAGMTALLYTAVTAPGFARFWAFGELRLLALFLLPAIVLHTWCCVSVLPPGPERRLAVGCAAGAMILLLLLAPAVDLGLRRWVEAVTAPALR